MTGGLPIPDFDFDDCPLIPLDQNFTYSNHFFIPKDLKEECQKLGLQVDFDHPLRSTSNSVVFSAINLPTNSSCALKISKHRERITKEFNNRKKLPDCPYLVQSFAVSDIKGYGILQMELCPEGDITCGKFNESDIWKLINNVGIALRAIHECGWIHLDVSPSNILSDGRNYKLADFGTLLRVGEFKSGYEGAGPYVSPETMSYLTEDSVKADVGPPTDIFSFGVVLMEIASGYLAPRGGEGRYADLRRGKLKLGGDKYKCVHSKRLIDLVNQMIDPEPCNRPTAEELSQIRVP